MGIEINTGNTGKLSQAMYESISKMSGNESADLNEVVGKAMEILAGANLNVTKADTAGTGGINYSSLGFELFFKFGNARFVSVDSFLTGA